MTTHSYTVDYMLEVIASVALPELRDEEGRYHGQGFRHDGDTPVPLSFNHYHDAKDDWAINIEWDDGHPFCINHLMSPNPRSPDIVSFGERGSYEDWLFRSVFDDGTSILLDPGRPVVERVAAYKAFVRSAYDHRQRINQERLKWSMVSDGVVVLPPDEEGNTRWTIEFEENAQHDDPLPEFTEGLCGDGAAILKDGQPMSISEILAALRKGAELGAL